MTNVCRFIASLGFSGDKMMKPELPKSLGGTPNTDGDGLVYLEYTIKVDPSKYVSSNYRPIANAAKASKKGSEDSKQAGREDKEESAEETESIEVTEDSPETSSGGGAEGVSEKDIIAAADYLSKEKGIEGEQAQDIIRKALNGDYEVDEDAISYFVSILPEGQPVLVRLLEKVEGEKSEAQREGSDRRNRRQGNGQARSEAGKD